MILILSIGFMTLAVSCIVLVLRGIEHSDRQARSEVQFARLEAELRAQRIENEQQYRALEAIGNGTFDDNAAAARFALKVICDE